MLRARMAELEGANRTLAREAYSWQQRYEQLVGPSLGAPQQQPPSGGPRLDSPFPSLPTPGAEKRVRARLISWFLCFYAQSILEEA